MTVLFPKSTSYVKSCWIRSLLLVLYFSNWIAWRLIILTNTFLTPKGSAPCLNIRCRKTLAVLIYCTTEEVAQQIRSISALIIWKNIFDGIMLLLYGNLTTLNCRSSFYHIRMFELTLVYTEMMVWKSSLCVWSVFLLQN